MLKHPRLICSAAMLLAAAIGSMSSFGQPTPPADPAPAAKKMDIGPDGETLITIHVKDAFPEDAFSAIAKQSGIRFTAQPDTMWDSFKDDLTIDIDKKPFWVAVQELCAKTGLTIQQNGGNSPKRLTLIKMAQSGMTAQPPTFVSGAFMFRAESMNYNRSIYFGRPEQPNQNCNLQMLVSSDPNVKILATAGMVKLTEATDDKGNSLMMKNNNMYFGGMNGYNRNGMFWNANINLDLSSKTLGTKLTSLKGTFQVRVQAKSEIMEFGDLLAGKAVTKTAGDFTIVVSEVKKTDAQVTVKIEATNAKPVNRNDGGQDPFYLAVQMAQLLDDKNRNFQSNGMNGGGGGNGKYTMTLIFSRDYNSNPGNTPLPDPAKLVIEVPTEVKDINVPVEFKDIPLP